MRARDLLEMVRRQPFNPFRLHTSGGKTYDVLHPDQIIVLRSRAVLPVEDDESNEQEFRDRLDHVALTHVERLEELTSSSSES